MVESMGLIHVAKSKWDTERTRAQNSLYDSVRKALAYSSRTSMLLGIIVELPLGAGEKNMTCI